MSANEYKITETLQQYYDKVFEDGKLVNLHIGMWGMSYNLTEEDIKLVNKLPNTIKLGKKMLIKTEVYNKFKNFEQKARKYLYTNSFDFPLVSQAHFVPKTKYLEVYKQLNTMREEYLAMVNEFVDKYEAYKAEALEFYQEHKDTVNIDKLESYYPSLANVRSKFHFDIVSFEIALPAQFNQLNLQDEIEREISNNEAREHANAKYLEEYNKQIQVHTSKLSDFMNEVTATVRGSLAEHLKIVLSKIDKKEVVSDASIKKIHEQIQEFRSVNFADDKVVEAELNKLEKLLEGKADYSSDKDALGLLKQHLTNVVKSAEEVSDVANVSGEYFRKLSV
jgi:hypothetical protein